MKYLLFVGLYLTSFYSLFSSTDTTKIKVQDKFINRLRFDLGVGYAHGMGGPLSFKYDIQNGYVVSLHTHYYVKNQEKRSFGGRLEALFLNNNNTLRYKFNTVISLGGTYEQDFIELRNKEDKTTGILFVGIGAGVFFIPSPQKRTDDLLTYENISSDFSPGIFPSFGYKSNSIRIALETNLLKNLSSIESNYLTVKMSFTLKKGVKLKTNPQTTTPSLPTLESKKEENTLPSKTETPNKTKKTK